MTKPIKPFFGKAFYWLYNLCGQLWYKASLAGTDQRNFTVTIISSSIPIFMVDLYQSDRKLPCYSSTCDVIALSALIAFINDIQPLM